VVDLAAAGGVTQGPVGLPKSLSAAGTTLSGKCHLHQLWGVLQQLMQLMAACALHDAIQLTSIPSPTTYIAAFAAE